MKLNPLLLGVAIMTTSAQAVVHFDHEEHPIPLIDLTVVLPIGFEARAANESGAATVLSDILENGTATLDRQAFLDKLAAYGASLDFSSSNLYSYWKLSFPLVDGMNYDGLVEVLAENWRTPRFSEETFKIAKTKLEAALTGSLDNDMGLGSSTMRRWLNKNVFGGSPVFLDRLAKLDLATTKKVYERDFLSTKEVWAGLIGPQSSAPLVEKILRAVFVKQGEIDKGPYLQLLKPTYEVNTSQVKPTRTVIIVDKPERNQLVSAIMGVAPQDVDDDELLGFYFGNHVLLDSGLGSVFMDEIRTKRGLAYSVGNIGSWYLGLPSLGFVTNPRRDKQEEAVKVIAQLIDEGYENASTFTTLPKDVWERQWQSYRYSETLDRATPMGRLGARLSVVTGSLTRELYDTPIEKWHETQSDVSAFFKKEWSEAVKVAAFVGEAKEIKPLVQKAFKGYDVKVIPYKDTLKSTSY